MNHLNHESGNSVQASAIAQSPTGPPTISTQPTGGTLNAGQTAQFTVVAGGTQPLYYQWRAGATNSSVYTNLIEAGNISGSTSQTLTITTVTTGNTADYVVVITNSAGSVTSSVARLTVLMNPPTISMQPVSRTLNVGQTAQFTVSANGTLPLYYQWRAGATNSGVYTNLTDGGQFSGSTTTNLTITDLASDNTADYVAVITNAIGSITSSVARLTILPVMALVYEPFDYPAGTGTSGLTNNADGGTGWLDPGWVMVANSPAPWNSGVTVGFATNPPSVINPGLTYPGLLAAGNAVNFPGTGTAAGAYRKWDLASSGLFSATGNSVWFSFLYSSNGAVNTCIVDMLQAHAQGDLQRGTGIFITNNTAAGLQQIAPRIQNAPGGNTYNEGSAYLTLPGGTALIVGRITYNGGTTANLIDTLTVWVNPALGSVPSDGSGLTYSGTLTMSGAHQNGYVVFRASTTFNGNLDELRIGTNYASVVPPIPPVTLDLELDGADFVLSWLQGSLLEATNLLGPWVTNHADSPYTVSPTNAQMFYRVKVQ